MNTVTFKSVFDRVIRLHGRNPKASVTADLRDAIVEHINSRVGTICNVWRWPEWELTEERAFRQVWNANHQYARVSLSDGRPDEVFYLGAGFITGGAFGTGYGYYTVRANSIADPPIGTLPTNTLYWEAISDPGAFISYQQTCRRGIGMALGVYASNPLTNACWGSHGIKFMPSQRGIEVSGSGNPTVFLHYKMPVPQYTMVPYVAGKTYKKSEIVFDPTMGECFQALAPTFAMPADQTFWRRVPFLAAWKDYVANGAFADSLMEVDQGGVPPSIVNVQYWNQQADDAFQQEVDSLVIQGQRLRWNFCKTNFGCWCETLPWSGGTIVSSLSSTAKTNSDGYTGTLWTGQPCDGNIATT